MIQNGLNSADLNTIASGKEVNIRYHALKLEQNGKMLKQVAYDKIG